MARSYSCVRAGRYPTERERGEGMFHPDFDYGLGKERVVQMRTEIEHNRLEARLTKEDRLAKAAGLGEQARLAKARLGEQAIHRRDIFTRGTSFVTALFR